MSVSTVQWTVGENHGGLAAESKEVVTLMIDMIEGQ